MKHLLTLAVVGVALRVESAEPGLDTNQISQITGLAGVWNDTERVYKISQPRSDVKVSIDRWSMPPFMGLTTWASFTPGKRGHAMVMGDFVLFEDEVNHVLTVGFENGLDITALHNHFFYSDPPVYFMHIAGEAPADKLSEAVRRMLDRVKAIRTAVPQPAKTFGGPAIPGTNRISAQALETILGEKAQVRDGMAKFVFGRTVKMECGCQVGKEMGVNTWAAFGGTDENAVVAGDFAMREDELQMVIRALRHWDINIVAIHHHMCDERPRMIFLHYWGKARAARLAQAVKTALDTQKRP